MSGISSGMQTGSRKRRASVRDLSPEIVDLTSSPPLSQHEAEDLEGKLAARSRKHSARASAYGKAERTPKRRKSTLKECSICFDRINSDFLPLRPHAGAEEDHTLCYECWEKHLHSELERKEWNKLSCPECNQILDVDDVSRLDVFFQERVGPKIMDKATRAYLTEDPDWVDCPSGTCKSGASMSDGNIFTCQECNYRYCFSCQIPMHEGEACSEYYKRLRRNKEKVKEEEQSLKTVEKVSKPCPKCKARLQKSSGCDHFTCKRCKHEFCWICFADYGGPKGVHRRGNAAHNASCQYSPQRLPSYEGEESSDSDAV